MLIKGLKKAPYLIGALIPAWLGVGVLVAGSIYPGYDHINQAMSELGAAGSPTQFISPVINNYPIGVLFIYFGFLVIKALSASPLAKLSGLLILIHGIGSIAAGYFSCDAGCNPELPSNSQMLHNLSGLLMFTTLTAACALWVWLGKKLLGSNLLCLFSLGCLVIGISVLPFIAEAADLGQNFGLFQRINYGISVVWIAGLAYALHRSSGSS
jgi:hypothetical protein